MLDGAGLVRSGSHRPLTVDEHARTQTIGKLVFRSVLAAPLVTIAVAGAFYLIGYRPGTQILVVLGYAGILSPYVALAVTHASRVTLAQEGRRLAEAVGTRSILPQLLAALGAVFNKSGRGRGDRSRCQQVAS